jgi:hypothetical protein
MTPAERALRARIGAHAKWARTDDTSAATAPARRAFLSRFDNMVPADVTDPAERARRAWHYRQEYFARLSLAAARARSERAT